LATRITTDRAVADPGLLQPGQLFIDLYGGPGHSGMVVEVSTVGHHRREDQWQRVEERDWGVSEEVEEEDW